MRLKLFFLLAGAFVVVLVALSPFLTQSVAESVAFGLTPDAAAARIHNILALGLAAAVITAGLVTATAAKLFLPRRLPTLVDTARKMAAGDLNVRCRLEDDDPLLPLGEALDGLANNLSSSLTDLRAERDLVGRILERMEEGVLVLDADRRCVLVNASLRNMVLPDPTVLRAALGVDPERRPTGESPSLLDLRGKTPLELFRHADLEDVLDRTATDTAGRATGEIEMGTLKRRRLMVRAVRFQAPPWGYLLVFLDVTEIRRLESIRRDFVANVSHELRTPVTALRSASETLRIAISDPASGVRFLDIIERNADRLQNLIEDLLDLSRIESKEYRLNVEALDVARVVSYVLGLFRERADARQIRLLASLDPELPPLQTDRRALEQVLTNLIDNAVKYGTSDSSITVRAVKDGGALRIAVIDTGPGIGEEHLARLFERFYRVDAGRSRDRGGTGLGLSIVKHLVEAMNGTVRVESQVGQGSTFTVRLPIERPSKAA